MTAHYLCALDLPGAARRRLRSCTPPPAASGLLLTQMIKARGGYVIATTSTEEKAELARGAGADETIGYEASATGCAS